MQIRSDIQESKATLTLTGRFDFTLHKEFREAYDQLLGNTAIKAIEINLRDVDYLDSSALGMLLLLKDKAAQSSIGVTLANCRESVRQILEIANFQKLFTIT